jgi:hypothetical protein
VQTTQPRDLSAIALAVGILLVLVIVSLLWGSTGAI